MGFKVTRGAGNVWEARPYLGTDRLTGKPIRPYKSWPADLDENRAQALADEWIAGYAPASSSSSSKRLSSMLSSYVHDPQRGFSQATVSTYDGVVRNHIAPTIGDIPYDELKPYEVTAAYRILLSEGPGRKPIGRNTLRKAHALLSGAYRVWQRQLGVNPMLNVPAPAPDRLRPFALDDWDQDKLVAALADDMAIGGTDRESIKRRTTAFAGFIALNQALRCGEVCALQRRSWRRAVHDVYVEATVSEKPVLRRQPSPKRESVGAVSAAPDVERAIAEHIAWQDRWMAKPDQYSCLVTDRPNGGVMRPSTLSRYFSEMARDLGMPAGTTMHTLRHTHATWLLMNGYDMRTIQERLRHRDVATTLRLYASVMPGRDSAAASGFAEAHAARKEG